ncbi:unnamed protein product [Brassica napus]|uniref:(rape) hypothetical protein n=1 Tax=Brassica napus TaxID=3708 RepID=A0A816JEB8_BRANA|nr:unnamed protein product [Brassica napus]
MLPWNREAGDQVQSESGDLKPEEEEEEEEIDGRTVSSKTRVSMNGLATFIGIVGFTVVLVVLVSRLLTCETMSSATTICSEKTGTLTLNQVSIYLYCHEKMNVSTRFIVLITMSPVNIVLNIVVKLVVLCIHVSRELVVL